MQCDDGFAKCSGIARVKGSIPLLIFVAKANNHNVSIFDQGAGPDRVHFRSLIVFPEALPLFAQNCDATIIAGCMICDWRDEAYGKAQFLYALSNLFAPIRMDLTGEVNRPGSCCGHLGLLQIGRPFESSPIDKVKLGR